VTRDADEVTPLISRNLESRPRTAVIGKGRKGTINKSGGRCDPFRGRRVRRDGGKNEKKMGEIGTTDLKKKKLGKGGRIEMYP